MNPGVSREGIAGDICLAPQSGFVVPNVPRRRSVTFEVALRPPYPAVSAEGLVDVELQRLRRGWVIDIEVQIVGEMSDVVAARDGVEIELVGIAIGTAHRELGGFAVHRRRRLALGHGRRWRIGISRGADLAIASGARGEICGTGLPSRHAR